MKIEELVHRYEKYEHYVSPTGLIIGFVWHFLNLRRIDLFFDNLLVIFYLGVAGLTIIFINVYLSGRLRGRFFDMAAVIIPFVTQFAIGGLFSSFVVFYWESGSFFVSWPFYAILFFLLFGNEFFRRRYQRLAFQMSIYFTVIFCYLVFAVPLLIDRIGSNIFLVSGAASLVIIVLFILIIRYIAPQVVRQSRWWLIFGIGGIYLLFNVLYFTNIIPPIPLALKDGGISHAVSRSGANYYAQIESRPWYLFYQDYNPVFHWRPGQTVYCYAAVFAPTKITADIYHRWSWYDEKAKQWVEKSRVSYPITGGRDGGWRGYSLKQGIVPGKWRVDVMTAQGQILGRLSFEVVQGNSAPELTTVSY